MPPTLVVRQQSLTLGCSAVYSTHEVDLVPGAHEFASLRIPPRKIPPPPPAPIRGPWPALLFLASALTLTGTVLGWVVLH